jgi:2-polyprenyl-6-methoxyphenol hydroxylase-like FAD-dependent oxidoreductase
VVHPQGVAALARWGLRDRLIATGCPPVDTYTFDFGPFTIAGSPGTPDSPVTYCPRRTVLDKLLVDAAAEAGAEVRENFTFDSVLTENDRVVGIRGHSGDGISAEERARIVIGADGRRSSVAEAVRPVQYNEKPPILAIYYAYWSGLPMHGRFENYIRPYRGFAAVATHDDLTMIVGGWPCTEFASNKNDIEGNFLRTVIDIVPEFAERLRSAKRETRFSGTPVPNFFRKPYGPGWALVGDAGYNRDPITAQGISDAFWSAERCTQAVDEFFRGERPYNEAMADYQRTRDERVLPMFEFTCQLATLEPPSPQSQELFAAIHGNPAAMNDFARMNAGGLSPAEFLSPNNVERLLSEAHRRFSGSAIR